MAKIYGQLEKAQIEGVTADPTASAAIRGMVFHRTDLDTYRVVNAAGDGFHEFADLDSAQTMSAKILSGANVSNYLEFDEVATQTVPAAGKQRFYPKSDGSFYKLNSAGVEEQVGGSGAGGINYIENPDAIKGVLGWSTYNDNAAVPVDGTGGTVDANFTFVQSAVSPLRGDYSFLVSGANSTPDDLQGHGFSYDFTIDSADQSRMLIGSFDFESTFTADEADDFFKVYIYDVTNAQLIRVNGEELKLGTQTHYFSFQTAYNSTSYRLIVHQAGTVTASESYTLKLDNVRVGPKDLAVGSYIGDLGTYTPVTQGLGTIANPDFVYGRTGDSMTIFGYLTTGTPTAVEAQIGLPSGLAISNSLLTSGSGVALKIVGKGVKSDTGNTVLTALATPGDSYITFSAQTDGLDSDTSQNGSTVFSGSSGYYFEIKVPIEGWSSNSVMSEFVGGREILSYGRDSSNATITADTERIDFAIDHDSTNSWSQTDGNGLDTFTAPETGNYEITGSVNATAAVSNTELFADISGVKYTVAFSPSGAVIIPFSGTFYMQKGETLSIKTDKTITLNGNPNRHFIHIQKTQQPQTVFGGEKIAARYYGNAGDAVNTTASKIVYTTKDYDTHGAYSSGTFTAPESAHYQVHARFETAGHTLSSTQNTQIYIYVDGGVKSRDLHHGNGASVVQYVDISDTVYVEKGGTIEIYGYNAVTSTYTTSTSRIFVSIAKV